MGPLNQPLWKWGWFSHPLKTRETNGVCFQPRARPAGCGQFVSWQHSEINMSVELTSFGSSFWKSPTGLGLNQSVAFPCGEIYIKLHNVCLSDGSLYFFIPFAYYLPHGCHSFIWRCNLQGKGTLSCMNGWDGIELSIEFLFKMIFISSSKVSP